MEAMKSHASQDVMVAASSRVVRRSLIAEQGRAAAQTPTAGRQWAMLPNDFPPFTTAQH
jgi:hypothetical protein